METMAERLAAAMEARGFNAPALARAAGVSRATVYFILDGTTSAQKVRASTLEALCGPLRMNPEDLRSGNPRATRTQPAAIIPEPTQDLRNALASLTAALAATMPKTAARFQDELRAIPDSAYRAVLLGILERELSSSGLARPKPPRA